MVALAWKIRYLSLSSANVTVWRLNNSTQNRASIHFETVSKDDKQSIYVLCITYIKTNQTQFQSPLYMY